MTYEKPPPPLFASLVTSIPQPPEDILGNPPPKPREANRRLLTYLEPDETTVGSIPPTYIKPTTTPQNDLCLGFRHSGWSTRRASVLHALKTAQLPAPRVTRFCMCGSVAWILKSKSEPVRYRLVNNRCRDRWCTPCTTEKRRVVVGNIARQLEGRSLRLLTLTLKSTDADLSFQITRILKSFAKLRRRKELRGKLSGGLYFLEITFNPDTGQWHPHLHVLFEGQFIPQSLLADLWLDITKDSFIVDIRAFRNASLAAGYVAKYATKAIAANVFNDPARLFEAVEALHGRRTFQTFGNFTEMGLSKPPEDDTQWATIGSLWSTIAAARDGDVAARAILNLLNRTNAHDPVDIQIKHQIPP